MLARSSGGISSLPRGQREEDIDELVVFLRLPKREALLERHLHPKPELRRRRRVDRLGHIKPDRRPLDKAEPGDVQAQAAAHGVKRPAQPVIAKVSVADVTKDGTE